MTTENAVTAEVGTKPTMRDLADLNAERSVLAAILLDSEAIEKARNLHAEHFYLVAHAKMFTAALVLIERMEPVDSVTLAEELRRHGELEAVGGSVAISAVLEYATTCANIEAHASIVIEKWMRREAVHIVRNVEKRAFDFTQDFTGTLAHLEAETAALKSRGAEDEGRLIAASLSGPASLTHSFPPRVSLLGDGIISAGDLVLIFGRAKCGKTWITLQLALAMARCEPWFGIPTTAERVAVGFLELELLGDAMQARLRALTGGAVPETFHWIARPALKGPFDLVDKNGVPIHLDELREWIKKRGLKVVIVDALARATSCEQNDFSPLLLALDHLRADLNVAIVLDHHEGKPPRNGQAEVDDLDAMRGDSRLSGFPQAILRVVKKGNLHSIRFAGVSNGPTPPPVWFTLDPGTGVPRQVQAPEEKGRGNRDRILEVVRASSTPLPSSEVAKRVGMKGAATRDHLAALVDEGLIERTGENKATRYHALTRCAAAPADLLSAAGASPLQEMGL